MSVPFDLHTHTTSSDGSFSPRELVRFASEHGIKHLGITDHDTIDGISEAMEEGAKLGVEVIPGIELSLNYPGVPGSIHLLGLFIDYQDSEIQNYIEKLKQFRKERNKKMLEKLQKLGFEIKESDFPDIDIQTLGRAHIARKMVEKNYTRSINEAFEKYLKKNGKAYVNKRRYSIEDGIEMIHSLKGVACMAHPYTLKLNNNQLEVFIEYLKEASGLDGLEVFYPEHSPRFVRFYYDLCEKYHLIPTGGSDFHGENKPGNEIGCYLYPGFKKLGIRLTDVLGQLRSRHEYYSSEMAKDR